MKLIIRCHSHNLVECAGLYRGFVDAEAVAKGINAFENFARKCLIHDGDLERSGSVAVIKITTGEEWRSDGLEITGAEKIFPGDTCVLLGAFVDDVVIPGHSAKGDHHGAGSGFDARDGLHAL